MSQSWYYLKGSQPQGPFSRAELSDFQTAGCIDRQTLIWREGLEDWIPLSALDISRASPPPPPPTRHVLPPPVVSQVPSPKTPRQRPLTQGSPPFGLIAAFATVAVVCVLLGISGAWLLSRFRTPRAEVSQRTGFDEPVAIRVPTGESMSEPAAKRAEDEQPALGPAPQAGSDSRPIPAGANDRGSVTSAGVTDGAGPVTGNHRRPGETGGDATSGVDPMPSEPGGPASIPGASTRGTDDAAESRAAEPAGEATRPSRVVYQELQIHRIPQFSIAGTVMGQDLNYKLLSELRISPPDDKGIRTVNQIIKAARLVSADELSKSALQKSLRELEGWQFSAEINARGEVVGWESGPKSGRTALDVNPLDMSGFLVTSVMDEDGWKEVTALTMFAPDPQAAVDQPLTRQMTHDYGPLGRWSGLTRYQRVGVADGVVRYDYAHEMSYQPPKEDSGELPFKILDAKFSPELAGGRVYLDDRQQQVIGAEETFVLRGLISAEVLGQVATVETAEQQTLTLRITAEDPWESPE